METVEGFVSYFRTALGKWRMEKETDASSDVIISLLEQTLDEITSCLNIYVTHCSFCDVCITSGRRARILESIEWVSRVYSVSFSRYCPVHDGVLEITDDMMFELVERESETLLVSRNILKLYSCRKDVISGIGRDLCVVGRIK